MYQIGKVVFGSIRFTLAASKGSGTALITGLPIGKTTMSSGSSFTSCSINNPDVSLPIANASSNYARVITATSAAAATYVISFIYLAA